MTYFSKGWHLVLFEGDAALCVLRRDRTSVRTARMGPALLPARLGNALDFKSHHLSSCYPIDDGSAKGVVDVSG